jgi:hypothetical protein
MCIGGVLGACAVGILQGAGALLAWRAQARRAAAMRAVEARPDGGDEGPGVGSPEEAS